MMPCMSCRVGTLSLANPILTASGTFGYGLDLADLCPPERLGGIVTKGLSPLPRRGNAPPRIVETAAGMINAIGLQNIGVEAFCRDVLPELDARGVTVVVNVFGESPAAYREVMARCERERGVAAYELNVSCPNVSAGGMEFGHDPALLASLTAACRAETGKPLWVKLSPNAPDLVGTGKAAVDGGADALTLINTLRAMAIDAGAAAAGAAARVRGALGTGDQADRPAHGVGGAPGAARRRRWWASAASRPGATWRSSCSPAPAPCRWGPRCSGIRRRRYASSASWSGSVPARGSPLSRR